MEGLAKSEPELQLGGAYDGRPADFALKRFLFYECSQCCRPYFGGDRNCGAQQQQQDEQQAQQGQGAAAAAFNRHELLCGECSAVAAGADCPVHGKQYIEWKCKYCCNLAMWFCFGTTHMCNRCHAQPGVWREGPSACNPATCGLKMRHPQPGNEFCMGCGMCRRT